MDAFRTPYALDMSFCAFTDTTFSALMKRIREDESIDALILEETILSRAHLQRLVYTLRHDAKHVKALTLSGQGGYMREKMSTLEVFARMGLPRLCLNRNRTGNAPMFYFALNMQNVKHITHLNLDSNGLTAVTAKMLSQALPLQINLEHVSLCHNRFGSTGLIYLASGLVDCVSLKSLLLADTNTGDQGAIQLAHVLAMLPAFEELDLSSNPLVESAGWRGMCLLVQCSPVLRRLDLSNTNPGFDSMWHMSIALEHNLTLQSLEYNAIPTMHEDAQLVEDVIVQYLMRNQQRASEEVET